MISSEKMWLLQISTQQFVLCCTVYSVHITYIQLVILSPRCEGLNPENVDKFVCNKYIYIYTFRKRESKKYTLTYLNCRERESEKIYIVEKGKTLHHFPTQTTILQRWVEKPLDHLGFPNKYLTTLISLTQQFSSCQHPARCYLFWNFFGLRVVEKKKVDLVFFRDEKVKVQ